MKNRRKGSSSEKVHIGGGRWRLVVRRQQCSTHLGERGVSTRGFNLIESTDNELAVTSEILKWREGARSRVPSLITEEHGVSFRKSERSIRAEKSGNADGAKGPR